MKNNSILGTSHLVLSIAALCMSFACLVSCGSKEAEVTEIESSSEEISTVEMTTDEEETTTIEETEVAKTESVEDLVDDVIYNTGIIITFGIRQTDAADAAEFLDKISYGKIDASRRVSKGGEERYELSNKDGIIYYLVIDGDIIREILNEKGEFIVSITKPSVAEPVESKEATPSSENGNTGTAPSSNSTNADSSLDTAPNVVAPEENYVDDDDLPDPDEPLGHQITEESLNNMHILNE